jgi:hypothetical protein
MRREDDREQREQRHHDRLEAARCDRARGDPIERRRL